MEIISEERYINGQELAKSRKHKEASINKNFFDGDIDERYKLFENRFIDKSIRGTDYTLPKESFFPTKDFQDVVSEIVNQLPTNFNIVGTESEYLRGALIEGSHLKPLISDVYKEGVLSGSAFVLVSPKLNMQKGSLMVLKLKVLPYENCFPEYNILTNELEKLTYQERRVYMKLDTPYTFLYTVEYTKDSIRTFIRNVNGERMADLPDEKLVENPFKNINSLPVVEFKCQSQDFDRPYANKLRESQLQLDNLNTNIENLTNMHTNPIYVIENTRRDWTGFPIGAGQILPLMDNESFHIEKSDMQLQPLDTRYTKKRDEIYKTAGLVIPSLRETMYGTDSSKVVKIANGELIGFARILMNNFKKPLMKICEILLFLNDKKMTDEIISPPNEILPYDLETIFSSMAVGMNLGLVDDEWFWSKYMPELSKEQRDRISNWYKERQLEGLIDDSSLNVDNNAKISTTTTTDTTTTEDGSVMGNKEQAQTSAEDKDGKVTKQ